MLIKKKASNEPIYMRHATRNWTPIPSIWLFPVLPIELEEISWGDKRVESWAE